MYLTRLHAVHITVLSVVLLNLQGLAEDEQEVMAYANLTQNEHRGMRLAWPANRGSCGCCDVMHAVMPKHWTRLMQTWTVDRHHHIRVELFANRLQFRSF